MKLICIYDNHFQPNIFIKNIIGNKSFGEVILKRKSIKDKFYQFIQKQEEINEVIELDYEWQIEAIANKIKTYGNDTYILHLFSNFVISDENEMKILIKKLEYIEENYVFISDTGVPVLIMMNSIREYIELLLSYGNLLNNLDIYFNNNLDKKFINIVTYAFFDIAIHENFLQYISGGFDARFFNSLKGDEFVVTKSSKDKRKIKAEYMFYHLLPDEMKKWFVMPYNYQEFEDTSSYDMERYHMTDLAIRWVHGAIDLDELNKLLEKVFYFIVTRKKKEITNEKYLEIENSLYLKKLEQRILQLKNCKEYSIFAEFIKSGTNYSNLDEVVEKYKSLYDIIHKDLKRDLYSVIGHGDLCFSNMLFNKEANLLKLIDPKGALEKNDLWTNPYYDIAKLSHSICGRYDFFNNGLHHITLNNDLKFSLDIEFDNTEYKKVFQKYVSQNGFNYLAVRIYEVSLFLSMLPLHIDNPQKVFGFILNAIEILEEIEECLKK